MGCWNGTCGLTELPIKYNEPVDFLIIINQGSFTDASGFCYLTGYASPISFLMTGSYNDYGSVEYIEDNLASQLFLKLFREKISNGKIKVTPDSYYDKDDFGENPIDYTTLPINKVINLIERDRVNMEQICYTDDIKEKTIFSNIGLLMFHKDILNNMFPEFKTKELNDKVNSFFNKNKEDLLKIKESGLSEEKIASYVNRGSSLITKEIDDIRVLTDMNYVHSDTFYEYFRLIENEKNTAIHFLKLRSLIHLFITLRKSWHAQSGKGSQSDNSEVYLKLSNQINSHISSDLSSYIGEEVICYEPFLYANIEFNEDDRFFLFDIDLSNDKITLRKDNEDYIITMELFKNKFDI